MLAMNMNVSCEPEFDMNCNRTSYNPSPPLNLRLHCRVFPSPSRSRPGPRRRPPPRCVRCSVVNKREWSEEDSTWRAWRLGPTRSMVARKESSSLLRTVRGLYVGRASVFRKKNVPPADRSDPPAISLHASTPWIDNSCYSTHHHSLETFDEKQAYQ